MKTGEKMKAWRVSLGLGQREAAEIAGISQAAWCEYELDKGAPPKVDVAAGISRATEGTPHHVRIEDWIGPEAGQPRRKARRSRTIAGKPRKRASAAAKA